MLRSYMPGHEKFVSKADTANRYYRKKNDILTIKREDKIEDDPLRNADNRIPSNFYKLQVNQKAAYAFTDRVLFDAGNDEANETIKKALGDAFQKKCKALCVQAANTSVGWIHYWKGENGEFKYSVLDSREVVPIWNKDLEKELKAVLRTYRDIDGATGDEYFIHEGNREGRDACRIRRIYGILPNRRVHRKDLRSGCQPGWEICGRTSCRDRRKDR